jgi:predicted ATP-grasp superfamily ATP-dependent carboligase
LYADQVGIPVARSHARPGVGWLRAVTDFPTAALDLWDGELDLRSYWRSLKHTRTESVFCLQDPLPSIAEVLMLPYLVTRKYLMKSDGKAQIRATDDKGGVDSPAA